MYKKLNYLIQVDAPFKEREDRVSARDSLFIKGTMVNRDIEFRKALKKGNRYKLIDMKVSNNGSLEDLQAVADQVYEEEFSTREAQCKETMRQKYGGYKIKPMRENVVEKINELKEKDGLSK